MARTFVVACALLTVACGAAPPMQALGVVDLELALRQTAEGQRARERLMAQFQARQQELDQRGAGLRAERARLEGASSGPIGQAFAGQDACAAYVQYTQALDALRRDYELYQQQLAASEETETRRIVERLRQIAQRMADERGLVIVFGRDGYVAPGMRRIDLTSEVVAQYDRDYPPAQ